MYKIARCVLAALVFSLLYTEALAQENTQKKAIVLFYDIQDEIILAQKKNGDLQKGEEEVAHYLQKCYSNRFKVMDIKPAIKENNNLAYKSMLNVPVNTIPVIVQIQLGGLVPGATPGINISYKELFGDKIDGFFRIYDYGMLTYRSPLRYSGLSGYYIGDDDRTLVKNGVKACINTRCTFNPPNRYTNPQDFNFYVGLFVGDKDTLSSLPRVSAKIISSR